ncbi:MAG: hypothetical protein B6247_01880 [Candidatus Parabeggiatoa sp. nov. 2]|nr:MAG: hypothetical protein B6247_01880 [Beggiatoa sp. 4572_84]
MKKTKVSFQSGFFEGQVGELILLIFLEVFFHIFTSLCSFFIFHCSFEGQVGELILLRFLEVFVHIFRSLCSFFILHSSFFIF